MSTQIKEEKPYFYTCHGCGKEFGDHCEQTYLGFSLCPDCSPKKSDPLPKRGATTQELLEVFCHEFSIPGKPTFKEAMQFVKDYITSLKQELAAEKEDHAHTAEATNETTSRGLSLIIAERIRQIEEEGWDDDNDVKYTESELVRAALCYAENSLPDTLAEEHWEWPWSTEWDKRWKHDRVRSLAISGALIAAEIDRLHYVQEQKEVDLYPKWPNGTPATQEDLDRLCKKKASIDELRGALIALRDAHRSRYGSTIFEITSRDGSKNYNIHELCKEDPNERVKIDSRSEQTMVTNDYQASAHATPLEKAIKMHERHKDELRSRNQPYSPLVHTLDLIFDCLKKNDNG